MTNGVSARIVNYAFLQELKEENTSLWDDVVLLGSYGDEPFSADWIEQNAGSLLRRLRDKLAGQFRMEECLAYIPSPGARQSEQVTAALDQHLKILLHCVSLSEQCDDFEYAGKLASETLEIWKQMRVLYEEIMEHEALERRLIPGDRFKDGTDPSNPMVPPRSNFWTSVSLRR